MGDIDLRIHDLRCLETWLYREKAEQRWSDVAGDGASTIEQLQAENDTLRAQLHNIGAVVSEALMDF